MRVDQILNKLCLVKTRSIAKKACDNNLVKINGTIAKSSSNIKEDDILEYTVYGNYTKVRIKDIPTGNVSKTNASEYYELLDRKLKDR